MTIKNKLRFLIFSVVVFFFVTVLSAAAVLWYVEKQITTPQVAASDEQVFIVSEGESLEQIALNLEEARLIKNHLWFGVYVLYKEWGDKMQAGEYLLSPSLSVSQIARTMVAGKAVLQSVKVVIPEGFTLEQIDARLAKAGLIEAGELTKRSNLEGYLFPDTYEFDKQDGLEAIITKMRNNFDKKIGGDLEKEMDRQGKTMQEVITMASILEKEVTSYEDQRIVAGIFWQRIKDHYPLQSCATIAYVLGVDKWRYSTDDTKVDSPYNTYQNIGLPPGPINNPGLSTIKAAIWPQQTDYYFFLSKPNGETVFSKTLEEHNENKAIYLNN